MNPFIAQTDKRWFDFLASRASDGRIDEANFWSPLAQRPMKRMTPGEPVFFRLKSPFNAISGYGFFSHFALLDLDEAWACFDWKNGAVDEETFFRNIGGYRHEDLQRERGNSARLGCTLLRDVRFWPRQRWLRWDEELGWARNIVQGKSEEDPERAALLLAHISLDSVHQETLSEFTGRFMPLQADERRIVEARTAQREGQGVFKARLLDAYGRRCAVTGERTEPVLEAAHIQPYLGPQSNHLQNGVLLAEEFHTLFDRGYVTITPDYTVRVSSRIRDRWSNGRRYYQYDKVRLTQVPDDSQNWPSPDALEWHMKNIFKD